MDLAVAQEVMGSLYNWFERSLESGKFVIEGGRLSGVDFLSDGQYFLVRGSVFNGGLHVWPASDLKDEIFEGEVYGLAVPSDFEALVGEIADWRSKHEQTGYTSESFGGYSYTLGSNPQTGQAATWQDVFRGRLNRYRRLPGCL